MRLTKLLSFLPLAALVAACGRNSSPAVDDALKNDLALAAQAQPNAPISPTEAGFAPQPTGRQLQSAARQPARAPVRRTSSVRRSSSSGSGVGGGGGYYPAPAPRTTVEKHTQRDAAIGAAAGAVIGATSSRNKVKGGIIGAAVGGILGGVLGNNVDIQKKQIPF